MPSKPSISVRLRRSALGILCVAIQLCALSGSAQQPVPIAKAEVWSRYARFDTGPLPPSTNIPQITIVLRPAAPAALQQFVFALQDPRSPQHHRWLTPEQFAARFGAAPASLTAVQKWLRAAGVTGIRTARGGLWISFPASAASVDTLLHTEIRSLSVDGQAHFANRTPAAVPDALAPLIAGVSGLDDFAPSVQTVRASQPAAAQLAPADLASLYGFAALHAGGITGSGIALAIIGRTPVPQDDVRAYRARFALSQNDFQAIAVPLSAGTAAAADEEEATVDLEVAAAAAPDASLVYVWGTTLDAAAEWAIDNRLAAILSESYAGCENSGDALYQTLAMQAAAEGITWVSATGDSGAAACDAASSAAAQNGLHAAAPASTPGITAVGGTALAFTSAELGLQSISAYTAESGWSSATSVAAGGGGISAAFGMPGFQSDFAPSPSGRMLPDVAFAASPDSAPYAVVVNGQPQLAGGTSLATPLFAGILALVNQYLLADAALAAPGLGEINPVLYRLNELAPAAFHDITTGSNKVPCTPASANCVAGALGYSAQPGYDLATGLGSLDATALAQNWTAAEFGASVLTLTGPAAPIPAQQPAEFVATVTSGGSPLAASPVQFYLSNAASQPNQLLVATIPTDITGTARYSTTTLPAGVNTVEAIATGTTSVRPAAPASIAITVLTAPVPAPDFQLTGPTSLSISPASSATAALTLAPLNGFQQPVQFTCSTSSPLATCTIAKAITPTAAAVQIPVSIAFSAASLQPIIALMVLLLPLASRRRRALRSASPLLAIVFLTSCGAAGVQPSAPSSFTLTITATSTCATHNLTIPVQITE